MAGTPKDAVYDLLRFDGDFNLWVGGRIFTRPIMRNEAAAGQPPTQGSTPEAFEVAPPHRVLLSVAVLDGTEDADASGPPAAFIGFPRIVMWCQPKETEKDRMAVAFDKALGLLYAKQIPLRHNCGGKVRIASRLGVRDDKGLPGSVVDWVQLQVNGLWRVIP